MNFQAIILSKTGDFLIQEEQQVERTENGVRALNPYIINEDEEAHPIQAEEMFIPYQAVESIQYGEFDHETVK